MRLISLGEPIMRENQLGAVVDRRELPGNAAPCPLWKAFGNPENFLVLVHFDHLNLHDKHPLPTPNFSKRSNLAHVSLRVHTPLTPYVRRAHVSPAAPL